jgi:hypothetical protein
MKGTCALLFNGCANDAFVFVTGKGIIVLDASK